jgi:NADPH2:quinone reductase
MRAVEITRFGGPEVLDGVEIPAPEAGPNRKVHDVSMAGVKCANTHHRQSARRSAR